MNVAKMKRAIDETHLYKLGIADLQIRKIKTPQNVNAEKE